MDVEPLRRLGLTEGEIKVYLALVKLGETTVGPLVTQSTVSISKVYLILERLAKKGLASHVVKENIKHFTAASPRRLLTYLQEKEAELEQQEKALRKLLPQLELLENTATTAETAQVFDGLRGIQTARERTLAIMKKNDVMWIIGIASSAYDRLTPYFREYHKQRSKKGIRCNYLYNEDARKPFGELSSSYPLSEVRYMPKEMITHAWIEIYADTVTIGMNKGASFSVLIQNQVVADSFRLYAQLLWNQARR